MVERRKYKRLDISIPLTIKFLGTDPINGKTRNVSLDGLSIELQVVVRTGILFIQDGVRLIDLIPFLVSNEKFAELDIIIPPEGERIRAVGKVVWYDFGSRAGSHYFMAGFFLEKMELEDRKKWAIFVRDRAQVDDEDAFST